MKTLKICDKNNGVFISQQQQKSENGTMFALYRPAEWKTMVFFDQILFLKSLKKNHCLAIGQ